MSRTNGKHVRDLSASRTSVDVASPPCERPRVLGKTSQIDVVVKEPSEDEWRVVVEVLESEWQRARAVWMLEEKLNAYAGFVFEGHMRSLYPASTPAKTHIVIASVDPLPEEAIALLEKVRAALAAHSVKVSWNPLGGMPKDGIPPPVGFHEPGPGGESP